MKRVLLSIPLLLITSCGSLPKATLKDVETLRKTETQVKVINEQLDDKVKAYVDTALKSLEKTDQSKEEVRVAIRVLKDAEEIVGPPSPSTTIDVNGLLAQNTKANEQLSALEKQQTKQLEEKEVLEDRVNELEQKIADQSEQLAALANRSWFDKLKGNIMDYLYIIGAALVGVFVLPYFFQLIGWLIKRIFTK